MTTRRGEEPDEIEAVRGFADDVGPAGPDSKDAARRLLMESIDTDGGQQQAPRRTSRLRLRTLGLLAGLLVIPTAVALASGLGGKLASQVLDGAGISVAVDPASCPEAVAALTAAGVPEDQQPTVYAFRCPTSAELEEIVPQLRELRDRRKALER